MMAAEYILGAVGLVFLGLGIGRVARHRGRVDPASRTWLIVGVVFLGVAGALWTADP